MTNAGRAAPSAAAWIWLAATLWAALNLQVVPGLGHPVPMGLTFNEMLTQLLRGRFDISPSTIGVEAFQRDGRTYAYFGVFCALLRTPLLVFGPAIRTLDVTGWSLLAATAVSIGCRIAAVSAALTGAERSPQQNLVRMTVMVAAGFSGESVQYLRPSLYQEVVSWGDALAAGFGLILLMLVLGQVRRKGAAYSAMAALAGLALLCRVSFGVGLYAALGLVMAFDLAAAARRGEGTSGLARVAPAGVLLVGFALAAGWVNWGRWGDPFAFVPLRYQVRLHQVYPGRVERLARYGAFNLTRIPFALQYYFAPVWTLGGHGGRLLLQGVQTRLFEDVELPPGSLLLSDPVACLLAVIGFGAVVRGRGAAEPWPARLALVGLAAQALLMLGAISLTFRYRMDFYPAIDFAAGVGLAAIAAKPRGVGAGLTGALRALTLVGIILAIVWRMAYLLSPFGPAERFDLSRGLTGFYARELTGRP